VTLDNPTTTALTASMHAPLLRLSALTADLDSQQRASARLGWAISSSTFFSSDPDPVGEFKQRGFGRFVKSAVEPMLSTDPGVALGALDVAFLGVVNQRSLVADLVAHGALEFTLADTVRLQVGDVTASPVSEGAPKPITRMAFTLSGLPDKVASTVVVSTEALRTLGARTSTGIRDALASACARAIDRLIVDKLTAQPPASSADLGVLFASISGGAPVAPMLIGGADSLLGLPSGQLRDVQAANIAIATTPAAAGKLIALDASGVAIAGGQLEISVGQHADVLLDDQHAPVGSTVANLWQMNLSAIRCEIWIKVAVRDGAASWAATA
jgi:hypothetical protein